MYPAFNRLGNMLRMVLEERHIHSVWHIFAPFRLFYTNRPVFYKSRSATIEIPSLLKVNLGAKERKELTHVLREPVNKLKRIESVINNHCFSCSLLSSAENQCSIRQGSRSSRDSIMF